MKKLNLHIKKVVFSFLDTFFDKLRNFLLDYDFLIIIFLFLLTGVLSLFYIQCSIIYFFLFPALFIFLLIGDINER